MELELTHEERPWGSFTTLQDMSTHKVKEIVVKPGQRLSYQSHQKRAEHWFIVQGLGVVTLNGQDQEVGPGDTVDVSIGMKHRIANKGERDIIFIEVQTGTYFGEDDIERFEDDYGRHQR